MRRPITLPAVLGLLALIVCFFVYQPGLSSGFFFDDAANLPTLGESGKVDNASVLLRYVTAGRADPTGRPVALLSFLIDADDWPAPPAPFKRTNLLIHLACGVLLYGLLTRLGLLYCLAAARARYAALFAATAWLLHPLFVSTVLYIIQREAMLPALFVLSGLHLWLAGRQRMLDQRGLAPLFLCGMMFCTLLAFLSKPNGILLPLLALVIEATLPNSSARPGASRYRRWRNVLLLPASILVIAGLAWILIGSIGKGPANARTFTLVQRVLTEPTILIDYMKLLFLFDPNYGSLFHDQYPAATDAWHPWYTLPALLACLSACAASWIYRRHWPALAAAILFFFAGHLIESTSLALELYFEHRNYLPSMLLFWPIGIALTTDRWRVASLTVAVALIAGMGTLTWATAALWAKPLRQAEFWASEAPESPRAQAFAAALEAGNGQLDQALRRITAATERHPHEPQLAFTLLDLHCQQGRIGDEDWATVENALRGMTRDPGALLAQWTERTMESLPSRRCSGIDESRLSRLLDVVESNPQVTRLPGRMQDVSHLRGLLALSNGDAAQALSWFNDALRRDPAPAVALEQAARLGINGHPTQGLAHLAFFDTLEVTPVRPTQGMRWLHAQVLELQGYWPREFAALHSTLEADARRESP